MIVALAASSSVRTQPSDPSPGPAAAGIRIDYTKQASESTMNLPAGDLTVTLTSLFASLQLVGVF